MKRPWNFSYLCLLFSVCTFRSWEQKVLYSSDILNMASPT